MKIEEREYKGTCLCLMTLEQNNQKEQFLHPFKFAQWFKLFIGLMPSFSISPEQQTVFSNNLLLQQKYLGLTYFFIQYSLCLMPANLLPWNADSTLQHKDADSTSTRKTYKISFHFLQQSLDVDIILAIK